MLRQKLIVIFAKTGLMRFISHLDLMRLFQRASRRARLPVALSQGFSPHPKIGFKRALKLGLESQDEEAIFQIEGWIKPVEFKERLQAQLPEGIQITEVKIQPTPQKRPTYPYGMRKYYEN